VNALENMPEELALKLKEIREQADRQWEAHEKTLPQEKLGIHSLWMHTFYFPTQWFGKLEDGRHIYIRFRGGLLTIEAGEGELSVPENLEKAEMIFRKRFDDSVAGTMETDELWTHIGEKFYEVQP
jgi:hypothetical protein